MPTQTKENYLKAIYFLSLENKEVSITQLGEVMQVSKPTANNMIKKLTAKGWIQYEKYKPIQLTPSGHLKASQIIRKHRLTEMFLVEKMNFGWEEVHDIAEEMEHLKSEKLFDRMDQLLGHPVTDPHGSPIPDKKGTFVKKQYLSLSEILPGKEVQLKAVNESTTPLLIFLNEKNINLGTKLKVLKIESFDRMMTVSYDNYEKVPLSYEVCKRLMVKKV